MVNHAISTVSLLIAHLCICSGSDMDNTASCKEDVIWCQTLKIDSRINNVQTIGSP